MLKRKAKPRPEKAVAPTNGGFGEDPEVAALIRRVNEEDPAAFRELVERYKTQVAGLAFKMIGDYEDAKDISQIVFVKAFLNLKRFDTKRKFSTWLLRITVNSTIDYWRRYRKHKYEALEEAADKADDLGRTPEAVFFKKVTDEKIRKALDVLNPMQRSVFILRDMEGMDMADVAKIVDMPQITVRWHLHKARVRLRTELSRKIAPPVQISKKHSSSKELE